MTLDILMFITQAKENHFHKNIYTLLNLNSVTAALVSVLN